MASSAPSSLGEPLHETAIPSRNPQSGSRAVLKRSMAASSPSVPGAEFRARSTEAARARSPAWQEGKGELRRGIKKTCKQTCTVAAVPMAAKIP